MHRCLLACGLSAVTAFGVGCGSSSSSDPFGAEPDYQEVQGRFDHPDGTFDPSKAGSVIGNANGSGDANVAGVFSGGGTSSSSSSSTTTKALHVLGGSAQLSCADLQAGNRSGTCACPSGGDFQYEVEGGGNQSNADVTMKVRLDACSSGAVSVDGSEFMHMVATKNAAGQEDFRMLFVVKATVKNGAQSHTLDIAEEYDSGVLRIAVKVDDGWVAVTIKASGGSATYTVQDKSGSWTCTEASGSYSCSH